MKTAVATSVLYGATLVAGIYVVSLLEHAPLEDIVFECASALGTVGLSRGITGQLTDAGKVAIILLMFIGRVGPLTFAAALAMRRGLPARRFRYAYEDVIIG